MGKDLGMGISENIINYIKENKNAIPDITKSTGISEEKLTDTKTVFLAGELLEICSFLNIEPTRFVKEKK